VRALAVDRAGPPLFVFVGNLGRRKGVHVLLKAASLAREPWRVDLAGGVEESGIDHWARQEIDRLGLQPRVRLLGPVVGDAKLQLLAGAQGFVLPSLAEGLPMAMLEAMAAGLPVVVTAIGAMPEAVRDGLDGFVVPADDAMALALALDRLAADAARRQAMGLSAAARCESLYGIERMVQALAGVYAVLPGGRR
jgi:glycosyltransferase involved in cell wall biosynthesis